MKKTARTIVITGSSSGIGLAIAKALLQNGDNVVGNGRSQARLDEAAESLGNPENFVTVAGDIADPNTARRLFAVAIERFGHVDILVNNAGIYIGRPFPDYSVEEIDSLIDTNMRGFVYPSQIAATHMRERKHGQIISVTAAVGIQPIGKLPSAVAVLIKGGINQATRALALELAPYNIRVNAVAPGTIDTPMHTPDIRPFLDTLQPVGHIGTEKDIVDAVLFMAGARFATGVVLPIDGGVTAGSW